MTEPRTYRGIADGKWVYGWYARFGAHHVILDGSGWWDYPDDIDTLNSWKVIPETVGQSTGLKDKKRTEEFPEGQEVYGGDKLQDANGDIGIVYWKENIAGFYCKWGGGSDLPLDVGVAIDKCEVIGSIHDHLLKGAE